MLRDVLQAHIQEDLLRRRLAAMAKEGLEAKQKVFLDMCSELRGKDLQEMMEQQSHMVDWMTVAEKLRLAGEGVKPRSAVNCLIHYKHFVDRNIARGDFTEEEDRALLQIAPRMGRFHWDEIAAELGSQRSAWQCFARYQGCLAPVEKGSTGSRHVSIWTREQERRLSLAQQVYGRSEWSAVAEHVPEHSPAECRGRAGGRGRSGKQWSKEEDCKLLQAVQRHGANWTQVSLKKFDRSRSAVQRHLSRLLKASNPKSSTLKSAYRVRRESLFRRVGHRLKSRRSSE